MPKYTSAKDIMAALPQAFSPEAAAGLNAVLQVELSGEGGGQWHLIVAGQQLQIKEGAASKPSMTLKMAAGDYVAMINGEAGPMQMFMQGKIKVDGDMSLAMKMQSLFKMGG